MCLTDCWPSRRRIAEPAARPPVLKLNPARRAASATACRRKCAEAKAGGCPPPGA